MKMHKINLQEMQSEMPESILREGEVKREGRENGREAVS